MNLRLRDFKPKNRENLTSFLIFGAFLGIQIIGFAVHKPWRDEVEVWAATADQPSFLTIIYRANLYAYPPTFHLFLFFLHQISNSFILYRFTTLLCTSTYAFIIIRTKSMSTPLKMFWLFNYYSIFEFGIIQRSYAYELLFITMTCVGYLERHEDKSKFKYPKKFWIGLSFLCFFSPWALIFAIFFALLMIRPRAGVPKFRIASFVGLATLQIALIALPVGRNWNTPHNNLAGWLKLNPFGNAFTAIFRALVPIPKIQTQFWNSNFIGSTSVIAYIGSFALLGFIVWFARLGEKKSHQLFLSTSICIFLFLPLVTFGKQRHLGQIFILLQVAYSILVKQDYFRNFKEKSQVRIVQITVFIICMAQLFSAGFAFSVHLRHPLSTTSDIAKDIRESDRIIAYDGGQGTFLPILVQKEMRAYQPLSNRYSSNILFNNNNWRYANSDRPAEICSPTSNPRVWLLTNSTVLKKVIVFFPKASIVRSRQIGIEPLESEARAILISTSSADLMKLCTPSFWNTFFSAIHVKNSGYGEALKK